MKWPAQVPVQMPMMWIRDGHGAVVLNTSWLCLSPAGCLSSHPEGSCLRWNGQSRRMRKWLWKLTLDWVLAMKSGSIRSGHVGLRETTGAAKAVVGVCLEKQLNPWSSQLAQPWAKWQWPHSQDPAILFYTLSFPAPLYYHSAARESCAMLSELTPRKFCCENWQWIRYSLTDVVLWTMYNLNQIMRKHTNPKGATFCKLWAWILKKN